MHPTCTDYGSKELQKHGAIFLHFSVKKTGIMYPILADT
jgi:putative component of membrane protein insertase Oxa1/YidC/SpoIIIJ protein YidD